ncbi:MAG: carbohydrate ABC transporter permease [Clostridia bacterium]|nr:carbohydrate ABC transporter permease [Clostridia bacterium]
MEKIKKAKITSNLSAIRPTKGDRVLDICIIVALLVIGILFLYPLWLVVISSISDPTYISTGQVFLLPKGLNLDAYKELYRTTTVWIGYRNSLLYTFAGTASAMAVTTACAFALSRENLPFRRPLTLFFLFTMYFSGGLIPTFFVIQDLHLLNTVWCLILPGMLGPYNLVICRSYFENSIPEEIYESAQLEGAGMFRCFIQLAVPLAKPTLAVMVLNFALGFWNSYFYPMIYISDDNIQTLQVFIKRITTAAAAGLDNPNVALEVIAEQLRKVQLLKYAVVIVSTLPMILLYPAIRRYFISGMMIGAVKG